MSSSNFWENKVANALRGGGNGVNITAPAALYLKLHIGDPGEDCTANPAAETTRKEVQFGAASNGVIALSNAPSWTNVAASEQYTHGSVWDDLTAGNPYGSGVLTANAVVAGDTFNLSTWTYTQT